VSELKSRRFPKLPTVSLALILSFAARHANATLYAMRVRCTQLLAAALLAYFSGLPLSASQKQPAAPPPGAIVTLGDSAVTLTGPWKFSPGDSPVSMNPSYDSPELLVKSPDWAQRNFDDSSWAEVDLKPKAAPLDVEPGTSNLLPGWTAQGFPNLSGFAWYRIRIHLSNPDLPVALSMPADFEDAYQIYANGKYVAEFGRFESTPPAIFQPRPEVYALPPPGRDGTIELALRFYMSPISALTSDAGGMHEAPVIGLPSTLQLMVAAQNTNIWHGAFGVLLCALLFLLMAPAALWAWLENRRERAFLWLFVALAQTVLFLFFMTLSRATFWPPADEANFWLVGVLNPIWLPAWIMFWWYWFGLDRKRWIPVAAWLLAFAKMVAGAGALSPYSALDFLQFASRQSLDNASSIFVAATCLLLFVVLVEGFRRDPTEGLLALVPSLLLQFAALLTSFKPLLNLPIPALDIFGLSIDVGTGASILMGLVVGALVLRRFLRNRVAEELTRQSLEQELAQARELQQHVLLPEDLHSTNFTVETEYHPARIVGGDFFLTAVGRDGSLCIVIGDVSGKGISAAMLVAVLVGAARTRAAQDFDPITMLQTLDDRLSGRSGGHFATCVVAQLFPNGVLRVANAGHLQPYLNGCELDIEGSLPLGIAGALNPAKRQYQLRQGDTLTFITDGVVEARNKRGELFGFDQARVLSQKAPAEVVSEVQAFGQDDDITVLRVSFVRAEATGPTHPPALAAARA
jgi:hypothetical protein